MVIRKMGIRTCFQFFLLITRFIERGALFYHGRFEASNNKTIGLETLKPEHISSWLFDIGSAAFSLFRSSGSLAASDKDHSRECSFEVAVKDVVQ
jgi:hypothetical protein